VSHVGGVVTSATTYRRRPPATETGPIFDPRQTSDRFVIATVDYLAMVLVPPLQRAVSDAAPRAQLEIRAADAGHPDRRSAARNAHVHLGIPNAAERGLRTERLFDDELLVVLDASHPLAADELSAEDYASIPHVHVNPRRETYSAVDQALAAAGLDRWVAVEVPFFGLVPALLDGANRIATLPRSVAERLTLDHDLVVRPPPIPIASFEIAMAWHPTHDADPAQRWLRDVLRDVASMRHPPLR